MCGCISIGYAASVIVRRVVGPRLWLAAVALSGCFVDLPVDDPLGSACTGRTCSENGRCDDGACLCNAGFSGNPYALYGCQPVATLLPCEPACGANATCVGGTCRCVDGSVAVCGNGACVATRNLCDGTADCPDGGDERPLVCFDGAVQPWRFVDLCDDDEDIRWRVWAQDRDWVWPDPESTFTAEGFAAISQQTIECVVGELLCFGAESEDSVWGVGLDGRGACDDCCEPCGIEVVDMGDLRCE